MYCLDTNIVIAFLRGDTVVVDKINSVGGSVCITWLTVCELYRGVFLSSQVESNTTQLNRFLESTKIIAFSRTACELYGQLYAKLKSKGKPTQDIDLLIGALCIAHGKTLVTRNVKDFVIPDLKTISW